MASLVQSSSAFNKKHNIKKLLSGSIVLGFFFLANNTFIALSSNVPLSFLDVTIFAVIFLMFSIAGSYFVVRIGLNKTLITAHYFLSGIFVAICIMIADYSSYMFLFRDHLQISPFLIALTVLLTIGISFSSIRFLLQLSRERSIQRSKRWRWIGSIVTGVSLFGIPLIVLVSVMGFEKIVPLTPQVENQYLFPYLIEIMTMLILWFVPDILGETRELEQTKQILDNEQQFHSLLEHNLAAVFMLSPSGNILHTNKPDQKKMHYMAYYDDLTGFPNRRFFIDKLTDAIGKIRHTTFSIMILDIDKFKKINDLFGHRFGDMLLFDIAKKLDEVLPSSVTIARLGGDEFGVFIPISIDRKGLGNISKQLMAQFEKPVVVHHHECLITTSIGIVSYPQNGISTDELLKNADIAMYHSKAQGGNTYHFYLEEMNQHTLEKESFENDLRRAIENGDLLVYYQPKYNTMTGKMIGMEALVRWNDCKRGIVSPDEFIPLAENLGLIIPLEKWVFRTVCRQMKEWLINGMDEMRVSVNISQRHFYQEDIVQNLSTILLESGLSPHYIEIEVTESTMILNEQQTIRKLKNLKKMGIEISLDDFGTGYSSLSYMNKLPIDRLKIDKSFVSGIRESKSQNAIISTIISMANHLGLRIIAEGVETKEQIDFLKKSKCFEVQGYYYSPPVPAKQFEKILFQPTKSLAETYN
jgi:diguanylate cyclase (GGDEF)-like protein